MLINQCPGNLEMRGRYDGEEVMEAEGMGEISAGGTWHGWKTWRISHLS